MVFIWIWKEASKPYNYHAEVCNSFGEEINVSPSFKNKDLVKNWLRKNYDMFKIVRED